MKVIIKARLKVAGVVLAILVLASAIAVLFTGLTAGSIQVLGTMSVAYVINTIWYLVDGSLRKVVV